LSYPFYFLLGVMQGHWNVHSSQLDFVEDDSTGEKMNVGIATVTPATSILDLLNQNEFEKFRLHAQDENLRVLFEIYDNNPSHCPPGMSPDEFKGRLEILKSLPLEEQRKFMSNLSPESLPDEVLQKHREAITPLLKRL
jgi:hypothetical protein